MANNNDDMKPCKTSEALWSRRAVLKMIAGGPLVLSFGMVASPLMRFAKPTMKPLDYFQGADMATPHKPVQFSWSDLPESWTCLPFQVQMRYLVFNAEQYEIRTIPGFIIRLPNDQIVAFSRICPRGCHFLNYVIPTASGSCGCADLTCAGYCISYARNPSLICPQDRSAFDLTKDGCVTYGPARRPPRQFTLKFNGDVISITGFEPGTIA